MSEEKQKEKTKLELEEVDILSKLFFSDIDEGPFITIPELNKFEEEIQQVALHPESFENLMNIIAEKIPYKKIFKKATTRLESEIKEEDLEAFTDFYTSIKELNQNIVRINSNIEKTKLLSDIILDPSKNTVDVLWDELEYFMKGDKDYKIEKIERDKITIKALRREAFLNTFIMAKIFGRILPYDCKFILNIKNYRGKDIKEDLLIYEFLILAESNFYKGSVFIKFQED